MPIGSKSRIGFAVGPSIAPRSLVAEQFTTPEGVTVPTTMALAVREFRREMQVGDEAGGAITLTFEGPLTGELWEVERVLAIGPAGSPFTLYQGAIAGENRLAVDPVAQTYHQFDNNQPVRVTGPSDLIAHWPGATAGSTGRIILQYRVVELVSVPLIGGAEIA